MIIDNVNPILSKDAGRYAWSELRRFHNIKFTQSLHVWIASVPAEYSRFATKQAEQLKLCLIQAREYATSAEVVSLATKPLLLYYSCMSLALAEILMKQTGESSLDRARNIHNHHGLIIKIDEDTVRRKDDLQSVAEAIIAKPLIKGKNERAGTFELWHLSARGLPGVGLSSEHHPSGALTKTYKPLISPEDIRLPLVDKEGISLLKAMACVPGMSNILRTYGHPDEFVRGQVSYGVDALERYWLDLLIHPTTHDRLENLFDKIKIKAPIVDRFHFDSFGNGGNLHIQAISENHFPETKTPHCCNITVDEVLFWDDPKPQNEFCYIYLTLYMLGNFARYYPDLWIKAIELNHPIATASERFMEIAAERMPLCILSELSRTYHLPIS